MHIPEYVGMTNSQHVVRKSRCFAVILGGIESIEPYINLRRGKEPWKRQN